jgi:hypothetical protein
VAVVALTGDVLTDVVQQCGELEHLAVAVAENMQIGRLIEQAQREARDLRGVGDIRVTPPGQARDRRPA